MKHSDPCVIMGKRRRPPYDALNRRRGRLLAWAAWLAAVGPVTEAIYLISRNPGRGLVGLVLVFGGLAAVAALIAWNERRKGNYG